MKRFLIPLIILQLLFSVDGSSQPGRIWPRITKAGKGKVNTKVDNIGYWNRMVKLGYVLPDSASPFIPSKFTGSTIQLWQKPGNSAKTDGNSTRWIEDHYSGIPPQNSPDVPVTGETGVTQSENSVFIDPGDELHLINSNNSTSWISGYAQDPYGADALHSMDEGETWQGSTGGVNGNNNGDPATAIGLNGWWYVGKINGDNGQGVSYSKDQGKTWTKVTVGSGPLSGFGLLDKNHLWIDNSPASPYKGSVYAAWTNFIPGYADTNQIQFVRSANHGLSWSSPHRISVAAAALKLNHGVNINSGPNGDVYVTWSIYDNWPADENAIGFTKSTDGGLIFAPATRIISNIKGIRATLTGKNMRVHSFPSMAVDISTGPHRGNIYIVWPNVGYPGINTGSDIDIYLIKSSDGGTSWSNPVRVNQDPAGLGKQHFFPWITCDPVTGGLCVVYYDDRNASGTDAEVFVSYSYDGGLTWSDMQVSDNIFTPAPIPGLSFSYFGDYIGIQSENMKVYPVWTDNHLSGRPMSFVSPFNLGPNPNQPWIMYHSDSLAQVNGTGPSLMNMGDSLHLSLGLQNTGDQPAANVTALLTSPSPYVTITDSLASYGSFSPAQVKIVPDGFAFKVSDTIPDNLAVRFNIKATGTDSVWYSHFAIESHAPDLQITGITIVDTLNGNHNGRMDPGETVETVITTINNGDFKTSGTMASISTASPYFTPQSDSIMLGVILPGQSKQAIYTFHVDENTPPGMAADLLFTLRAGLHVRKHTFRQVIGMVDEDWETNSFAKFPWKTGGYLPWTLTTQNPYEGIYCVRSGQVPDYKNSQLFLTYTSTSDDSISFYVKTSSEQDYDYMMFTIDAVYQGQWSGETPWTRVAFPVSAGTHTFKWIYLKDLSFSNGSDCAWIDFIAFPPPVVPEVNPGADTLVCTGQPVYLKGSAQLADSTRWSTLGDGTFDSDTTLIANYFPGIADIANGSVTLRLTGFGSYTNSARDKHVTIRQLPAAIINAVPATSVCAAQSITLSTDTAGIASYQWTPGSLTTSSIYCDTANSGGIGNHLFQIRVTDRFNCTGSNSLQITFKDCTAIEELQDNTSKISPNPGDGLFYITLQDDAATSIDFLVQDEVGNLIRKGSLQKEKSGKDRQVDARFLPNGVYLLTLTTTRGTTVHELIIRK